MTTTTQQLLRDIALFNMVFPVGTKLQANLVTGVTEVTVTGKAELIGNEPMFKGTYGNNFTPLLPCQCVQIPENYFADWFNEKYPVGTWVWLQNKGGTYAVEVVNPAQEFPLMVTIEDGEYEEDICEVKGKLKAIIEFEDNGQDFSKWYINEHDVVVDCKPYQASVWNGSLVNLATSEGGYLDIISKHCGDERTISHPIESIQRFDTKKEVQNAV